MRPNRYTQWQMIWQMLPVFTVVNFRIDDIKIARINAVEAEDRQAWGEGFGAFACIIDEYFIQI